MGIDCDHIICDNICSTMWLSIKVSLNKPRGSNMMKRVFTFLLVIAVGFLVAGCASPAKRVKLLKLGMSPDEVREQMGDPYTVRAAKIYENGEWTQIWEYQAPPFSVNPKNFWMYFENGKLVQWGEPGDFTGSAEQVQEYSEQKQF